MYEGFIPNIPCFKRICKCYSTTIISGIIWCQHMSGSADRQKKYPHPSIWKHRLSIPDDTLYMALGHYFHTYVYRMKRHFNRCQMSGCVYTITIKSSSFSDFLVQRPTVRSFWKARIKQLRKTSLHAPEPFSKSSLYSEWILTTFFWIQRTKTF